jgi:hypothetical protein
LKDANFGDLFVGGYNKPESIDHLFMSIQTFNSQDWASKTSTDFYDTIIVDEFHHAAAPTYQKLLTYYQPQILLGLTATPERMDGQNVTEYFGNRIAAEIRLPEAIDRKLLCPFQYFGVTDTIDLDDLKWTRGGYDKTELSNIYVLNTEISKRRCNSIISALIKYTTDINDVKGLGFCVSVAHAQFMSDYFNESGIPSMFLTGESPDEERSNAKKRLVSGEVRFIFVVDIYNEGVDIPEVNTVLFLRPTESLTIFLQQLGRGLRLADNKECLIVLDFIGQANKKYNFAPESSTYFSTRPASIVLPSPTSSASTIPPVFMASIAAQKALIWCGFGSMWDSFARRKWNGDFSSSMRLNLPYCSRSRFPFSLLSICVLPVKLCENALGDASCHQRRHSVPDLHELRCTRSLEVVAVWK